MTTKKRTIPQLTLAELSGDCTLCIFDSTTLSYMVELWGVTLFPATFLTVDGRTIQDLRQSRGDYDAQTIDAVNKKIAILDDFERGITMGCDIRTDLQGIVTAILALKNSVSSLQSAVISTSCCNNGASGVPDYSGEIPEYTADPDDLESNILLCKRLRYAQWVVQTWSERYIAPIAGLTVSEIIIALGASIVAPPWSTTILEIGVAIVAGVAALGAAGLVNAIADALPVLFDDLYCAIRTQEVTGNDGLQGWINAALNTITEDQTVATVITWIIGASGAMQDVFLAINLVLDVPTGFEFEPCSCESDSAGDWVGITECGTYAPDRSGENWVEFDGKGNFAHTCGREQDNGYQYFYIKNQANPANFTGSLIYTGEWSDRPTVYPISWDEGDGFTTPTSPYIGAFNAIYARSLRYSTPGIIRIEWEL